MIAQDTEKLRAKIFFKYLIHVAKRHNFKAYKPKTAAAVYSHKEISEMSNFLEKRAVDLTEERIKALETKINIHYTQNKYLPFEERLKLIKKRIYAMRRKKNAKKDKLNFILGKVKSCENLLKNMKQNDISEVDV
jgi:hypothetical protein